MSEHCEEQDAARRMADDPSFLAELQRLAEAASADGLPAAESFDLIWRKPLRRETPMPPPPALRISLSDPRQVLTAEQLRKRDEALRNLPGERL